MKIDLGAVQKGVVAIVTAVVLVGCSNLTSTSLPSPSNTTHSGNPNQVEASVDKYNCKVSPTQVPAGATNFVFSNSTQGVVEINVAAPKNGQWTEELAKSGPIRPGASLEVAVDLKVGPYSVLCIDEGGERMVRLTAV